MLSVRDLEVRYGAVNVLRGVSLDCGPGSLVCVLGPNGAGKTTLLRAISHSLEAYGGSIRGGSITYNERNVTNAQPDKLVRLGVVQSPEGRGIFASLSVDDNLRVGGFTVKRRDVDARVKQSYEMFPDLVSKKSLAAGLLSGGQQQMLAIARALMAKPKLLLLDEPSLGLAPLTVDAVAEYIRLVHQQGTSVLLVEQNAGVALELAEYAYVLEEGRIGLHGPSAELIGSDEIRRLYLGVSTSEAMPPEASVL
jgi:branched-chain amino acid transport system ATP-binding protein